MCTPLAGGARCARRCRGRWLHTIRGEAPADTTGKESTPSRGAWRRGGPTSRLDPWATMPPAVHTGLPPPAPKTHPGDGDRVMISVRPRPTRALRLPAWILAHPPIGGRWSATETECWRGVCLSWSWWQPPGWCCAPKLWPWRACIVGTPGESRWWGGGGGGGETSLESGGSDVSRRRPSGRRGHWPHPQAPVRRGRDAVTTQPANLDRGAVLCPPLGGRVVWPPPPHPIVGRPPPVHAHRGRP